MLTDLLEVICFEVKKYDHKNSVSIQLKKAFHKLFPFLSSTIRMYLKSISLLIYTKCELVIGISESETVSRSVVFNCLRSHELQLPGSTVHGLLQARILEWVANSLLQGIFPTQGLNPSLLHCSQILCHLSHQGRPSLWHKVEVKWQPTPVFLPGESQRWPSLVGCCLWVRTESETTEATQQQQQQQQR